MPVRNEGLVGDFLLEIVLNPGGDDCILNGGSSNMFQCTIEYVLHQQNLFFGGWNVFGKTEGHTSPNRKQINGKNPPLEKLEVHKRTDSPETCI